MHYICILVLQVLNNSNMGSNTYDSDLRKKAEELLKNKSTNTVSHLSDNEMQKLIHEFEIHQIELELINEELKLANEINESANDKYVALYDFAPNGYYTLTNKGEIIGLNLCGAKMLGSDRSYLINKFFALYITIETRPIFKQFLERTFKSKATETCELTINNKVGEPVYLHLTAIADQTGSKCFVDAVDISDRKHTEEALYKSELLLKSSLESQKDNIIISIDKNFCYLYFNKAHYDFMLSAYGKEVEIGVNCMDYITIEADKIKLKENFSRTLKGESHSSIRIYGDIKKDYFETYYSPLINDNNEVIGISIISRNVTERTTNEKALKESEELNRIILETAMEGYWQMDMKGNITEVNESYCRMSGYSKEELLKMKVSDVEAIETTVEISNRIKEIKKTGEHRFESRHKRKDGTYIDVEISTQYKPLNDGMIISFFHDISHRKQAELALKNVNHLYSVLSKTNIARAQAKDKQELYKEVCRIVVENGDLKMAWIGEIDENINKVVPIVSAGFVNGYLDTVNIDLNDEKRNSGPTGRAAKTGKHYIAYDIANSPDMQLWKDKALQNGYFTSAAFPIKIFNKVIGVFTLYADESYSFNKEEVNLLDMLVKNISNSIEYFEVDTIRHETLDALKESEEKYRSLFNNVQVGIYRTKLDGSVILDFNKQYLNIFGYSREEMEGYPSINYWADLKELEEMAFILKRDGYVEDFECKMLTKSGKIINCLTSGRLYKDEEIIEGTIINITERKQAENALIKNTEILKRTLIKSSELIDVNAEEINYEAIADSILEISGAKYVGFNLFDEDGLDFTTVALSGIKDKLLKVSSYLGYEVINKKWKHDPVRADKIKNNSITKFDTLHDLTGIVISKSISILIEKTFDLGYVYVVKITKNNKSVGDFTLLYKRGETMHNSELVELFANQIGLYIKRKKAEETLKESEQFLKETQEIAKLGSYSLDVTTGKWSSSEILDSIFGIDDNYEKTVEGWLAIIHPDWQKLMNDYFINDVLGAKTDFYKVYKIINQNTKTEHWVSGRGKLKFDEKGNPIKMIGTIKDITDQKEEEIYRELSREILQILNKSEDIKYSTMRILSTIKTRTGFDAVGIRLKDAEDFPYIAQKGFSKEFLLTENSIIERSLDGSICRDKDGNPCLECTCGLVISGKTDPSNPIFTKGGSCFLNNSYPLLDLPAKDDQRHNPRNTCIHEGYASIALIPIKSKHNIIGLIHLNDKKQDRFSPVIIEILEGITSNIGESLMRKQTEVELKKAKEKAEESDRLKSAFLANMSHEIRTPMNGILGFADLLKEPHLSDQKQQYYINIIEKSGARMLNIINNIVSISKIESGTMETYISETNINEQIEYIHTFFKPEAEQKKIDLIYKNTLPDSAVYINSDREKLYGILTNLVKNAIKFTDKGSIEIGYNLKNGYLVFYVKDTGIGVPLGRQEAIFERFIQADTEDQRAFQGAGLGLSISKAYVEMLGGKMWLESKVGVGSTFYFTIPYNNTKTHKEILINDFTDINETIDKGKLRILIVEDDETSDHYITTKLRNFSKEILHASNGIKAVEICQNNPDIDLILMDINMPEMNGFEATRQIRRFNKVVVILAQTAYALKGDREKALDAGCNNYLPKPIDGKVLMELMKKYFGES